MSLPLPRLAPTTTTNNVFLSEREGSSGGVRKALPHSLEGGVRTSAAVSAIYILTFLGSWGQGVSLLFNTRIQVLFRVGGTPRTWEVASGLAGALGPE